MFTNNSSQLMSRYLHKYIKIMVIVILLAGAVALDFAVINDYFSDPVVAHSYQ